MAHDYAKRSRSAKHAPKAKTKPLYKPSVGTLLSVLVIAGFAGGLYYLAGVQPEIHSTSNKSQPDIPAINIPSLEHEKLGPKSEKEPTYTFYEKLKKMQSWEPNEIVDIRAPKIKEDETESVAAKPSTNNSSPKRVSSPAAITSTHSHTDASKNYVLQAGSYRNFDDANNQRVKLIINGVRNTKINTVTLVDGKINHRIEVGPFNNKQDMLHVKQQLAELNVNSFSRTVK